MQTHVRLSLCCLDVSGVVHGGVVVTLCSGGYLIEGWLPCGVVVILWSRGYLVVTRSVNMVTVG